MADRQLGAPAAKRTRRSVVDDTFVLTGMSRDVERSWAKMAPMVLKGGAYPRVYCQSLRRAYLTEDFFYELMDFPFPVDQVAAMLRDSLRYPEMLLMNSDSRDAQKLARMDVLDETVADTVLLTPRGMGFAYKFISKNTTFEASHDTLVMLAAVTSYMQGEDKPSRLLHDLEAPAAAVHVERIVADTLDALDVEKVLPMLKKRCAPTPHAMKLGYLAVRKDFDSLLAQIRRSQTDLSLMLDVVGLKP